MRCCGFRRPRTKGKGKGCLPAYYWPLLVVVLARGVGVLLHAASWAEGRVMEHAFESEHKIRASACLPAGQGTRAAKA
jgi:hypothetical protein